MAKIQFLFFKPTSFEGNAIAAITHSPYCHVGVQVNDEYYEEQNSGMYEGAPRADAATVLPYDVDDGLITTDSDFGRFVDATVGHPYSWSTILVDFVNETAQQHWIAVKQGEHVCSGWAAWAAALLKIKPLSAFGYQPDGESPGDLYKVLTTP